MCIRISLKSMQEHKKRHSLECIYVRQSAEAQKLKNLKSHPGKIDTLDNTPLG